MKIIAMPNQNSGIKLTTGPNAGKMSYDMIDLVGTNDQVWASVMVDFFHGTDFYEGLRRGIPATIELAQA